MNLFKVNTRLYEECLDMVNEQEWELWENYYLSIITENPYLEYELVNNNRSLAWLVQTVNSRHKKLIIS